MGTALVIDDSRAIRMILGRTLNRFGYEVCSAANGREALAMMGEQNLDLSVILVDWNMPEMSGIEFLTGLRDAGSTVPFGFVTSEGSDEMRGRAESAGAAFLIAKPFTADTFRDALAEVLS